MDSYISNDSTDRSNQNQGKVNNCQTIINPFKSLVSQVEQARIWVQKCNVVDDGKGQSLSNDKSMSPCDERTFSCAYPKCKKIYKNRNSLISHQKLHQQKKNEIKQGEQVIEKIETFFRQNVKKEINLIICKTCGYSLVPEKLHRMKEHIETHIDG